MGLGIMEADISIPGRKLFFIQIIRPFDRLAKSITPMAKGYRVSFNRVMPLAWRAGLERIQTHDRRWSIRR